MPKALITGITGFVASHLAEYLMAETDWDIAGLARWSDPLDNLDGLIPDINAGDRIWLVEGDLNDPGSLMKVMCETRPDYVFHLAAQSYVQASFAAPAETLRTNMIGTLNLLEAVRREARGAWVHVCSSSEVYGRVSNRDWDLTEDAPFHPASPYAISKVGTDLLGRFYAEAYGLKTVTTRMFTHTGPRRGDVFAESSFAKQIAMIEAGQIDPVVKVGNLDAVRTIADVRDAVRAHHMLLTVKPRAGAVYNIGGQHTCTVGTILEVLFGEAGFRCSVEVDPARLRPIDADHQVPDCSAFMEHTGWKPQIPFEQTMADLLEYWRARVKRGVPLQR